MKKSFFTILFLISLFIFAGCSEEITEENVEELQKETTTWNGPTSGPWDKWDRSNNGNQHFKYELVYDNEDRTGWVTIDVKDLGNDKYEFDVELTVFNYYSVGTSPDGETTYNNSSNFILNKNEGFYEATYEKGELSEIVYEIIGSLDEQNSLIANFQVDDIVWEEGKTSDYSGNRVNVKAKTEILGIAGYEVEMISLSIDRGIRNYVINPDIKYPLDVHEESADGNNIYKFNLVEYNFN